MKISVIVLIGCLWMTSAWDNSPPIAERHPGWSEGKGRQMIEIEAIMDLTCGSCADAHPELKKFLDMPFLNGLVRDAVKINYVF